MNKDYYKNAINQIHPNEELKKKTLQKMLENKKRKIYFIKAFATCAMILIVCFIGQKHFEFKNVELTNQLAVETKVEKIKNNLPRFESMQELKSILKENNAYREVYNGSLESSFDTITKGDSIFAEAEDLTNSLASKEFSTTNVQVENVDEADIVKTDGEYIYYITNNKVFIIKADTLEIVNTINENMDQELKRKSFSPHEIFINKNFLVILGNEFEHQETKTRTEEISITEELAVKDVINVRSYRQAKAMVYNISDKRNPILIREVELAGDYSNSRMIGNYVYFISTQNAYYTDQMKDEEILPYYKDSASLSERKTINYTDIVYFNDTKNHNFTIIAGFDITNQEDISIETFFGAGDTIYASEHNLYLAKVTYDEKYYIPDKSTIYKFNLRDGQIILQCKAEIKGNLDSQFSMDEYNGNLRIATTAYDEQDETINQLYILDENLKQIGKLENLAKGEEIYAVRFIGKIGYIVTFEQIDPLFVIDLSDPTNPQVKGELKIPGYSSYLHPYDENHIIGIGYNTKVTKYGSVTNTNMKMSMFDVSDLENPKEMFSVDIGEKNVYSEVIYNHKALFYHKNRNLIGFPATIRRNNANKDTNNFVLYQIDLEKGFIEYGNIEQKINYKTNINRAIYIDNILYTLAESKMVSYNLDNMEKLDELEYTE